MTDYTYDLYYHPDGPPPPPVYLADRFPARNFGRGAPAMNRYPFQNPTFNQQPRSNHWVPPMQSHAWNQPAAPPTPPAAPTIKLSADRVGRDRILIPNDPHNSLWTTGNKAQICNQTIQALREAPSASWTEKVSFLSNHFLNTQFAARARGEFHQWNRIHDPTFYTHTFVDFRDGTFTRVAAGNVNNWRRNTRYAAFTLRITLREAPPVHPNARPHLPVSDVVNILIALPTQDVNDEAQVHEAFNPNNSRNFADICAHFEAANQVITVGTDERTRIDIGRLQELRDNLFTQMVFEQTAVHLKVAYVGTTASESPASRLNKCKMVETGPDGREHTLPVSDHYNKFCAIASELGQNHSVNVEQVYFSTLPDYLTDEMLHDGYQTRDELPPNTQHSDQLRFLDGAREKAIKAEKHLMQIQRIARQPQTVGVPYHHVMMANFPSDDYAPPPEQEQFYSMMETDNGMEHEHLPAPPMYHHFLAPAPPNEFGFTRASTINTGDISAFRASWDAAFDPSVDISNNPVACLILWNTGARESVFLSPAERGLRQASRTAEPSPCWGCNSLTHRFADCPRKTDPACIEAAKRAITVFREKIRQKRANAAANRGALQRNPIANLAVGNRQPAPRTPSPLNSATQSNVDRRPASNAPMTSPPKSNIPGNVSSSSETTPRTAPLDTLLRGLSYKWTLMRPTPSQPNTSEPTLYSGSLPTQLITEKKRLDTADTGREFTRSRRLDLMAPSFLFDLAKFKRT